MNGYNGFMAKKLNSPKKNYRPKTSVYEDYAVNEDMAVLAQDFIELWFKAVRLGIGVEDISLVKHAEDIGHVHEDKKNG